ncbi:olfactomedin-4-like [Mixophyes fleayi]|uniref:olfactomedin-4-like n=1 Tax=Mixophyes fleayi TaxID=3061075 RepID=UPI003F4DD376
MLILLLLSVGICQAQTVTMNPRLSNSSQKMVTGSLDDLGVCYCSVVLPDSSFPADRMEFLETSNYNLSLSIQQELTKILHYQNQLDVYIEKIKNLTRRVEFMEMGGVSYTELDFELLKLEIRQLQSLVGELRSSLTGSNENVEALYVEIHNMFIMVTQLEKYDKNNVLSVRREIVSLQKRLDECKRNKTMFTPSQVDYGTCDHGGIVNISKPFVVQLNWQGFSYKYGGWGRDSLLGADQSDQWVAPLNTDARMMNTLRFYPSYNDLLVYANYIEKTLQISSNYANCGQGAGMIMFNKTMYYNCYNSRNLCKFNRLTNVVERLTLTDATYTNRFSYSSSAWQDIDLASDEEGLWVIYATEQKGGNMLIGKLDATSLMVKQTWSTSQYKRGVTNAFIVCGVLYATRTLNTRKEEIFYMYDTKTNEEGYLSIQFDKMMENVQSLSYNPNDHKLYMYNDGYLMTYDLGFMPLQGKEY